MEAQDFIPDDPASSSFARDGDLPTDSVDIDDSSMTGVESTSHRRDDAVEGRVDGAGNSDDDGALDTSATSDPIDPTGP